MDEQTNTADTARRPRRLVRRLDYRMIAGVAAGIGDYFGVDPVLVRIGFVVLALAGGAGIALYLIAWLIMPAGSPASGAPGWLERDPGGRIRTGALSGWIGVGLLVIGSLILLHRVFAWNGQIVWALLLIAAGVFLWRYESDRDRTGWPTENEQMPPPPARAAATATADVAPPSWSRKGWRVESAARRADRAQIRLERAGSRGLAWAAIGVAILATGVAGLLNASGAVPVSLGQFVAIPLAVLGIGMLVGAWWGRARWLVVPAVVLALLLAPASTLRVPLQGGVGKVTFRPASTAGLATPYRLTAGRMTLDLTGAPSASPATATASVAAGELIVRVPADAQVRAHATVDIGQLVLFGRTLSAGVSGSGSGRSVGSMSVDRLYLPASAGTGAVPDLVLDLHVGFGQILVERSP